MALSAAASELGKGNFSNAFSYLFVDSDVLDAQRANERYQKQRILEKQQAGQISTQKAAQLTADATPDYESYFNNPETSVTGGFVEGAKEGLAAEQKFVKSSLTNVTGGILGFIPWWVWIVGGIALFFYMGGGKMLKGALAK